LGSPADDSERLSKEGGAREHPDLLLSVERGPDVEPTRRIARDVAAKLEPGAEDDLLDVGCGSGLLLSIWRERCRSVFGVDFAASQLALGRKHFPDIPFASAEALPFSEARFSRILCYGVWHYVDNWRGAETASDLSDGIERAARAAVVVGAACGVEAAGRGRGALAPEPPLRRYQVGFARWFSATTAFQGRIPRRVPASAGKLRPAARQVDKGALGRPTARKDGT
jgi:SAM-dependent methyltransferase